MDEDDCKTKISGGAQQNVSDQLAGYRTDALALQNREVSALQGARLVCGQAQKTIYYLADFTDR